jgi:plasmid maintenance system antidote protein VapI
VKLKQGIGRTRDETMDTMTNITPLKRMLMERGLKNRWLAQQIGVHEATVSLIVNGKQRPYVDVALKIARVLGTTTEELWGWTIEDWLLTSQQPNEDK